MNSVTSAQNDVKEMRGLKKELARLTGLCAEAERRYESFQVDVAAEARVQQSLIDLRAEEATLIESVTAAKRAHQMEIGAHARTKRAHKALKDRYDVDSADVTKVSTKLATLRQRIVALQREHDSLLSSISEKAKNEQRHIDGVTKEARITLARIERDIVIGLNEIAGMEGNRAKARELTRQITKLEADKTDLEKLLAVMERTMKDFEEEVRKAAAERAVEREAFEAACNARKAELDAREEAIVRREGDVSFSRTNLRKKAGLLRQARGELEEIHGKQLRHIIIPEDDDIA